MTGQTISHYKILEKLGGGGMGVVYKAQDLKLDRFVALKFLSPHLSTNEEEKQRFIHEAKAASALDHSNICVIHEIDETDDGQLFICMAYYEGETLAKKVASGQLSVDSVIEIATQIANGLAKAHEHGIIHRDIKSANLIITKDGVVKILDFGLAKLAGRTKLTKTGSTMGTAAYMSPEQVHRSEVDHRTDIWSLGVVIYEMLTGQLPFEGEYEQAVMYAIVNMEPQPIAHICPSVPTALERMVSKAMAKDLEERYQHVDEILTDLRALGTNAKALKTRRIIAPLARLRVSKKARVMMYSGLVALCALFILFGIYFVYQGSGAIESIAVMPFQNVKADPDMEFLSDGMAESITNKLSRLRSLKKVIARSSVLFYKNQVIDPAVVGNQLGVQAVLVSSFRQRGEALFITVELVNTKDNRHIWGNQYDSALKDIFLVQDEIVNSIIRNLQVKLTAAEEERVRQHYTENTEAYELYLKGRHYWNKRTFEGMKKGLDLFQQALDTDPGYALAYVGLADCFVRLGDYGFFVPRDAYSKAKAAALRALELDSTLAEAFASLGSVKSLFDRDWFGAEKDYQRAIALNPNYAPAHQWRAVNLASMAPPEAGLAEARRALELDPLSQPVNAMVAYLYYLARKYDQAQEQFSKVLEMNPRNVVGHDGLAQVYLQKSLFKDAIAELQASMDISSSTERIGLLGFAFAMAGKKDEARKILRELDEIASQKFVLPTKIALIYMALGEHDQAFKWLDKAYDEERSDSITSLKLDPAWDPLRSNPRFTALLRKLGLEK